MDDEVQEPPDNLSDSLGRMSLLGNENASSATNPLTAASPATLRKLPSTSTLKARSLDPTRRRVEGTGVSHTTGSPVQSRRTSGLEVNGQMGSPGYGRTSSMSRSPKLTRYPSTSAPISEDETPPVTAASVASDFFRKELALHTDTSSPETLVIIHDACYGHRFSRPKTSKTSLSLIVERPERLQAGITGIASAYVKMGGRHTGTEHAPHPRRNPSGVVPFGIKRSSRSTPLTSSVVTAVHGTKWMQDLTTMSRSAADRLASGSKELTRPDTPGGGLPKPKLHEGDLYLCRDSLDAFQGALGGVLDAVDAVFRKHISDQSGSSAPSATKRAFVCVRPPGHHCSADLPSGFCWLNNVHVGIEHAAQVHGLTHAAIIDFDLHHGDGSQNITWERNAKAARAPKNMPVSKKTSIGYFSLHDINSYPCEYGDEVKVQAASLCLENAHNQTIWNVHLQPWKTEAEFWALYESRYLVLLEKAKHYLRSQTQRLRAASPSTQPKSAIFISAGFDASEHEGEGMQRHKVNVPTEFYARFTQDILAIAEEVGTSAEGRVISVLEGGYSNRALMSGVLSHVSGLAGRAVPPKPMVDGDRTVSAELGLGYDKTWWNTEQLQELETLLKPVAPHQPKKTRTSDLSTFASPTQSFSAKVVDPSKLHRSLSGAVHSSEIHRPATPPPPEVDWATAAHELSKLLIPSDRQVNSCSHEDLNEPKPKRDRHSTIGLPTETKGEKMQTRGRKAKVPSYPVSVAADGATLPIRQASSSSRRQTISDLPMSEDSVMNKTERPTTADAQVNSEGSTAPVNRTGSPGKITRDAAKIHRTRRASGALTDLIPKDSNVTAPPVPKLPSKFGKSGQPRPPVPRFERETTVGSEGSTDMDKLANGVKKITLKMPSKGSGEVGSSSSKAAPPKPPRKPAIPRLNSTKNGATKTTSSKSSKALEVEPIADSMKQEAIDAAKASLDTSVTLNDTSPVAAAQSDTEKLMPWIGWTETREGGMMTTPHAMGDQSTAAPALGIGEQDKPRPTTDTTELQTIISEPLDPGTIEAIKPRDVIVTQEPTPTPEVDDVAAADTDKSSNFISYDPNKDFGPSNQTYQYGSRPEALTWLPPNTNTPAQTPVKRRENLPMFSATGAIPFAAKQAGNLKPATKKQNADTKAEQNIFEVPDTPRG